MSDSIHGTVGTHEAAFSRLVPARRLPFPDQALCDIADAMDMADDVSDGPDTEENLYIPAGYTYLGQFVDHDLTLDTRSNLNPDSKTAPTNLRTPAFNLDCVYGNGPSDQPYLYEADEASLRIGKTIDVHKPSGLHLDDLLRNTIAKGKGKGKVDKHGRALIGDKRNDENSIVAQIQLGFIKFHNAVVDRFKAANQHLPKDKQLHKGALFRAAQTEVRWSYQRMLVEDYLPRIIERGVLKPFVDEWTESGDDAYRLFHPALRGRIPIEFAGAAYRFGHSMVRTGYRLNTETRLEVFTRSGESDHSLTGFQPLPASHVIDDWGRFFPHPSRLTTRPGHAPDANSGTLQGNGAPLSAVRLQFAYKIDPTLVGPLGDLPARISDFDGGVPHFVKPGNKGPALGLLNLRRSNKFELASGQRVKQTLGDVGGDMTQADLQVRVKDDATKLQKFRAFPSDLLHATPLWLYVLAEAQRRIVRAWISDEQSQPVGEDYFLSGTGAHTQLGPVGGRIVLETFYGLLDADAGSYLNAAPSTWAPMALQGAASGEPLTFAHMLLFAHQPLTDAFGV